MKKSQALDKLDSFEHGRNQITLSFLYFSFGSVTCKVNWNFDYLNKFSFRYSFDTFRFS